jgi:hypothetical protein
MDAKAVGVATPVTQATLVMPEPQATREPLMGTPAVTVRAQALVVLADRAIPARQVMSAIRAQPEPLGLPVTLAIPAALPVSWRLTSPAGQVARVVQAVPAERAEQVVMEVPQATPEMQATPATPVPVALVGRVELAVTVDRQATQVIRAKPVQVVVVEVGQAET